MFIRVSISDSGDTNSKPSKTQIFLSSIFTNSTFFVYVALLNCQNQTHLNLTNTSNLTYLTNLTNLIYQTKQTNLTKLTKLINQTKLTYLTNMTKMTNITNLIDLTNLTG